jgi:hypothetical protein
MRFPAGTPAQWAEAVTPAAHPNDRSKFVRFARAAALWHAWRRDGTAVIDAEPHIYAGFGRLWMLAQAEDLAIPEVPPAEREEALRSLEATLTFAEAIPISVSGMETWPAEINDAAIVALDPEPWLTDLAEANLAVEGAQAWVAAARVFRLAGERPGWIPVAMRYQGLGTPTGNFHWTYPVPNLSSSFVSWNLGD